jgi:hypothetical protein
MTKPPPVYVTGDENITPLIQHLEQLAREQCEVKALADSQAKIGPILLNTTASVASYS